MKSFAFFLALATSASCAALFPRDVATIEADIATIQSDIQALTTAVNAYTSIAQASTLINAEGDLETAIKKGTSDTQATSTLSVADGNTILSAVNTLIPFIVDVLNAVTAKTPVFTSTQVESVVAMDITTLKGETDDFANALIAISPASLISQANAAKACIDAAFEANMAGTVASASCASSSSTSTSSSIPVSTSTPSTSSTPPTTSSVPPTTSSVPPTTSSVPPTTSTPPTTSSSSSDIPTTSSKPTSACPAPTTTTSTPIPTSTPPSTSSVPTTTTWIPPTTSSVPTTTITSTTPPGCPTPTACAKANCYPVNLMDFTKPADWSDFNVEVFKQNGIYHVQFCST